MSTIDLTRHVRTPAGERYFHKPIGSPIGGGGRATRKVSLKKSAYVVDGHGYDEWGSALDAARQEFAGDLTPKRTVAKKARKTVFPESDGGPLAMTPRPARPTSVFQAARPSKREDPADVIARSLPSSEDLAQAKEFWNAHQLSDEDKEGLASDLGLDPRHAGKSIRELRRAIKDKKTSDDEREALKRELAKRVTIARETSRNAKSWASNLADKLDEAPKDADLAPIIGETLAAHPKLGPLAHLWDRLRLGSYNFRKKVREGEVADELPRIIARTASTILLTYLMLHLGVHLPGFGPETAAGE